MSLRVLLVDDDLDTSALVALQLRLHGLQVSHVSTTALALAIIPAFRPDAILLDAMLPGFSPRTSIARIRTAHPAPARLILASGLDSLILSELAGEFGAEVLMKPYNVDGLARSLLERRAP